MSQSGAVRASKSILLAGLFVLMAGAGGAYLFLLRPQSEELLPKVQKEELSQAIQWATEYIQGATHEDGKFVYLRNLNLDVEPKSKYNILRHAGAMYALGMAETRRPDPRNRTVLKRSAEFLLSCCLDDTNSETSSMKGIWSDPQIEGAGKSGKLREAKLGGTGLGLVGLLSAEKFSNGFVKMEVARGLGEFLLFMQEPDGSFASKFDKVKGKNTQWHSLYYPGEAALGLIRLYEFDPNSRWFEGALKALDHLAQKREGRGMKVESDHWALIATAELLKISALHSTMVTAPQRERLVQHGVQIVRKMLAEQVLDHRKKSLLGGFAQDGATTPTATRLEGLISSLSFIPMDESLLRAQLLEAVDRGIAFLLRTQVKEGEMRGAIPRIMYIPTKRSHILRSQKDPKRTEVRIDYVQHALSAFIQYESILN